MRVPYEEMVREFVRILVARGFAPDHAARCAQIFAGASRDGVHSHGLNRFPRFAGHVERGIVDPCAQAERVGSLGLIEQWDGHRGAGGPNAWDCMERAIRLAREHGLGCVALRNTNHWGRGGAYGWQAAEAGCLGLCWTNTMPNLPPWGARECKVGNNPLILAVPHPDGPIVLDIALSQYAYGKLDAYRARNEPLPLPGGCDESGRLTCDAAAILTSRRPLPIGYWKGAGLGLLLDLFATLLSGGLSTMEIGKLPDETGLSQVFMAFDAGRIPDLPERERLVREIVADLHAAAPAESGEEILYPGERALRTRRESLALGVVVDPEIWRQVKAL